MKMQCLNKKWLQKSIKFIFDKFLFEELIFKGTCQGKRIRVQKAELRSPATKTCQG